jgi:hypothetical protein
MQRSAANLWNQDSISTLSQERCQPFRRRPRCSRGSSSRPRPGATAAPGPTIRHRRTASDLPVGGAVAAINRAPIDLERLRSESAETLRRMEEQVAGLHHIRWYADYMSPTIGSGDLVLIDRSKRDPSLAGIFSIRSMGQEVLYRLELIPGSEEPTVRMRSSSSRPTRQSACRRPRSARPTATRAAP